VIEIGQGGGDTQLLAGGAEVEADAPVEPVGAGAIELAQVTQQLVGVGLDACRQGPIGAEFAEQHQ